MFISKLYHDCQQFYLKNLKKKVNIPLTSTKLEMLSQKNENIVANFVMEFKTLNLKSIF